MTCKTIIAALIAMFAAASGGFAAENDEAVRTAEKNWADAVVARDFAALENIYSDDLIYAHSTGIVETKAAYLNKLKSGTQKYDRIDLQNATIKTFGDSAIAHSIVRMQGMSKDKPFDSKLMLMHVWVKQNGHWHLVAHQTTKLEDL